MSPLLARGRYAPSPTGALHLGNLRTALLAWLFARRRDGAFVLRIEDLDRPRTRPGADEKLLDDLRWLGLDWDEGPRAAGALGPYYQSQREALYLAALGRLYAKGLLYPCYCTRAEVAQLASAPQVATDKGPRYPGTCRDLTPQQQRARAASGRQPAWRFRAPQAPITFADLIAGSVTQSVDRTVGDFVVRRSDGVIAYQLAVVVDDALMGVTQVVRGMDLLASTARQLALLDALGYPRPTEYAHVPLVVDQHGERLAKREASAGLDDLRRRGLSPGQVVGALATSCGLWPAGVPASPSEVLATFEPERLTRTPSAVQL
ncbi:MAG TPA: tRNA glutamyl-Q(34) synthetase GluQRS [Ktedonobacterales bacterium]